MKRLVLSFLLLTGIAYSQAITVTGPAAAGTISAAPTTLTCSVTSITTLAWVQYIVEDDPEEGIFAKAINGNVCPSISWNPANLSNGPKVIRAIAYDATLAVLASSANQAFTISISIPCTDGGTNNVQPAFTLSTAVTSNWSGNQTIAYTQSGTTCSGASGQNVYLYVDGHQIASSTLTADTFNVTTQNFYNADNHLVAVSAYENTTSGTNSDLIWSWSRKVTFSNTGGNVVPVELLPSATEIFLDSVTTTATITGTVKNTDATTTSPTVVCSPMTNTTITVAVVSSNCTLTRSAIGKSQFFAFAPTASSTTGGTGGDDTLLFDTPGAGFARYEGNGNYCIQVTASTGGVTPGIYRILNWNSQINGGAQLDRHLGMTSSGNVINYSRGPCFEEWVSNSTTNNIPGIGRQGTIERTPDVTKSALTSVFFNTAFSTFSWPTYAADLHAAGFTGTYIGPCNPWTGHYVLTANLLALYGCQAPGDQSNWETGNATYITAAITNQLIPNKLYAYGWFNGTTNGNDSLLQVTRGSSASWTTPFLQDAIQLFSARNLACTPTLTEHCYGSMRYITMNEEVDGNQGANPLPGSIFGSASNCGTVGGTCAATKIVSNGSTCTVTYPGWSMPAGNLFTISGATTAGFNSSNPNVYTATSVDSSTFTFPCSVSAGTYTAATDATLSINMFGHQWSGGLFPLNNAFSQIMSWVNTANSAVPVAWPPQGSSVSGCGLTGAFCSGTQNWMTDSRMGTTGKGMAILYDPNPATFFGTFRAHAYGFQSYSWKLELLHQSLMYAPADQQPWVALVSSLTGTYSPVGKVFTSHVVSFVGDLITMDTSHGIANVIPGNSRLTLSGQSTGADNGTYYIRSTPSDKTIRVVSCALSTGCTGDTQHTTGGSPTITFDNGHTRSWSIGSYGGTPWLTMGGCNVADIGHTFTVSGSTGDTFWNTHTGWYSTQSNPTCSGDTYDIAYLVPSGNSTGGTVSIIPDDNQHMDYSATTPGLGYHLAYNSASVSLISGAAGIEPYKAGVDPALQDTTTNWVPATNFNHFWPTSLTGLDGPANIQVGPHPIVDSFGSKNQWFSYANFNLTSNVVATLLLNPRLNSPPYGYGFTATIRTGSTGNLLWIHNNWDFPRTITVDLAPIAINGQVKWCYYTPNPLSGPQLSQVASGTNTFSQAMAEGADIICITSTSASTLVTRPLIGARLANITNATKLVVRYAYTKWPIDQPNPPALVNVMDCGSGSCTLPVDQNIGTIYYQYVYLDTTGKIISTGSIQTL